MVRSLQATLQRRFSATMFVALALMGAWAYSGVRRTVQHQVDHSLRSTSQVVRDVLDGRQAIAPHLGPMDRELFVDEFNRLIVVRDERGAILQANGTLARSLPLDTAAYNAARGGSETIVNSSWEGEPVRAIYARAPAGAPPGAAVVEVAMSLIPLRRDLRTILLLVAATVAFASLASLVGSGWLARSALAPVAEIAEQAKAISGGRTDQRITLHAGLAEFQHLNAVLNDMVGGLQRATDWHRRIVRDLGHDLRTPITALRASVEIGLWSERRPDEYRRLLGGALEEIDRLTLISDALVFLGRLESGGVHIERQPLDAGAAVASAVERMQQRVGGHVFRYARPDEPLTVEGDARLLGLALDQLFDNAKRHTPPGTLIEASAGATNGIIELTIEDDGPGVDEKLLPHLFEPFFRTDPARGRESGPGLGLALVARIVELHGGSARASRGAAGGFRVSIELPRISARRPIESDTRAAAPA
jgi:signal transduction histidine kinase